MRTYYVAVWMGDELTEQHVVLTESEKANVKTFKEKLNLKYWHTIIAWSLEE